ncbi:MAG: hypothetical protein ACOC2L_04965, partial [Candidatus Sumerlaeota bacterium]
LPPLHPKERPDLQALGKMNTQLKGLQESLKQLHKEMKREGITKKNAIHNQSLQEAKADAIRAARILEQLECEEE